MGRPEPCVLFAQTFVHAQLDDHVDEVLFAEPIVITACEILEQNSSSVSQAVSLAGSTLPSSFALEVFVQCEGETRFRRLCQPFLYSQSSSNLLDVEAVVTTHLVVRGSYRCLSLVIYGNTAEDLGQFSIEFDDNSLSNLVSSNEAKLEDLPIALHSTCRTVEESLASLKLLSLPITAENIPIFVRQFLYVFFKTMGIPNVCSSLETVSSALVDVSCCYIRLGLYDGILSHKIVKKDGYKVFEEMSHAIDIAKKKLQDFVHQNEREKNDERTEFILFDSDANVVASKELVDMLRRFFCFDQPIAADTELGLQNKNIICGLCVALLLSASQESCLHFVDSGAIEELSKFIANDLLNSSTVVLLLLGVIEHATRHEFGCERILGGRPRECNSTPSGISNGYSKLLKLFLKWKRHDVALLSSYLLHRLRLYEVASRYESAVLSVLGEYSNVAKENSIYSDMLSIRSQVCKLLKLINSRGPMEDLSPSALASKLLVLGKTEAILSYKSTSELIGVASVSNCDIDVHLLVILREMGFLPLSAALLSSPKLRSKEGFTIEAFCSIASGVAAILLSFLSCRSGLVFLLLDPELAIMLIDTLRGPKDLRKEECVPLRYASALISKGFVCSLYEVGTILEMHLKAVNAIDRLLTATPYSEEFLWILWELCGISRSECGRQAFLVLVHFPEAICILIEALHSFKESEPGSTINGNSQIGLATFHSAAEIFETLVTDPSASSLNSWIGHAMELHEALHSSSPGSIRKDAPTRLLELIDAGVIYHKNGAIGLLRYSAVLCCGGDINFSSSNGLISEYTDSEAITGDTSGGFDIHVLDNLGKIISEKTFDGVALRDSSIVQLTTAVRILAFISENSTVSVALYDEGAITLVCALLINCSFMLEKSSNNYDYLVDEGIEANSTSDLLLERNREQGLIDLIIPSLVLLINLLKKLKEAKEQHRNTKLMNAILRLHREVSPKLAACAADLSSSYPGCALGYGAVCHLAVSALSCWALYDWTPGLFHNLLANVRATSILAFGPKETCSLLCLLNDLFPDEGVWIWEKGMPLLSGLRKLAVGTLLGMDKEKQVNWYLKPSHTEKLVALLLPHLHVIAEIIQHYAISALVVTQDMLRVLILRISCLKPSAASTLLQPLLSGIDSFVRDSSLISELDLYKVYRYLDFLSSLLEHRCGKTILLDLDIVKMLTGVLRRCICANDLDDHKMMDCKSLDQDEFTVAKLCLPVFKSLSLLCGSLRKRFDGRKLNTKDCSLILPYVLQYCEVLPVGSDLLFCAQVFKDLSSCCEGQGAFASLFSLISSDVEEPDKDWDVDRDYHCNFDMYKLKNRSPLKLCWSKMLKSVDSPDSLSCYAIKTIFLLSSGCLECCFVDNRMNVDALTTLKVLFGIVDDIDEPSNFSTIDEMVMCLSSKISNNDYSSSSDFSASIYQALECNKSLALLLTSSIDSISSLQMPVIDMSLMNNVSDVVVDKADDSILSSFGEKFLWECPIPDRLSQTVSGKRKVSPRDTSGKRVKGDNIVSDATTQNAFTRSSGSSSAASGQTRRDTFRQRKPNTSRPPSMHVDDYVARERSVDGANANVIAVSRVGSSSGRPPSIHVDEFMARQRERQNSLTPVAVESLMVKTEPSVSSDPRETNEKSKPLKSYPDDDLQGIDIVFDGEDSDSDDKLPFPQPDDILQQPAPVIAERSPHITVDEAEIDANGASARIVVSSGLKIEESELSSRLSSSRSEIVLNREPSVSSEKKLFDQSDDLTPVIPIKTYANASGYPTYGNIPAISLQLSGDSRLNHQTLHSKGGPQYAAGSRYEQRVPPTQPPLPRTPPLTFASGQLDYPNPFGNVSSLTPIALPDIKHLRSAMSSPNGSAGPHPPLPPMPPSIPSSTYYPSLSKASTSLYSIGATEHTQVSSLGFSAGLSSFPPPLLPPTAFSRPAPISVSSFGGTIAQQQNDSSSVLQTHAVPQSSIPSVHQLRPLQPPFRRPQLPQHVWSSMQSSQVDHLQGTMQLQSHQLQHPQNTLLQSHHPTQDHIHIRPLQHEQAEISHPQVLSQQGDAASQQQSEAAVSLQDYFKDPTAITSLLSNKEELCRLLEQHPKLMQMLQERLGQQ